MRLRDAVTVLMLGATIGCKKAAPRMQVQAFTLDNGLEVELVSGPCRDAVAAVLLYEVGTDHDPPERSGLVEVLARATELAAGADHAIAFFIAEPAGLDQAIGRLAARLRHPAISADEVELSRHDVLTALAARRGGDPMLTATTYAAESVQPTPGDGWRGGVAAQLEQLDGAALDTFARAYLTAGNARLVVVGRFDPTALRARLEETFGTQPAGQPPVARAPVVATVTGTIVMGDAPTTIAIAVPAPPLSSPLFPAFLLLASRPTAGAIAIDYDPIAQPATLFVTGAMQGGERPEAGAARVRADLEELLARPLAKGDVVAAQARFGALATARPLDPAACGKDPRGFALARARRAQLGVDAVALAKAIAAVTPAQLAEAAALFDAKRTAAVVAGGAIR